ncbi:MAG: tetratricopeptide repeat protein, partial [Candidatus Gastranaerophilales bacterium]|nr:tetratricopeptide repeat protein [Candidatus Gastranaerophilales bacterium]
VYPENSEGYCAFGYIYLKEKDIESARKYVNKSLKLNPNNQTAMDLLDMVNQAESDKFLNDIISAYESQNYSETMRLINEAMDVNKKDPSLYYYKALTYIAQNNYAASTAALYKCIELDKNNAPAYFYLGIAFDNLSEPKNALMYYQKFIELLPADDFGESERLEYAKSRINKLKQT